MCPVVDSVSGAGDSGPVHHVPVAPLILHRAADAVQRMTPEDAARRAEGELKRVYEG